MAKDAKNLGNDLEVTTNETSKKLSKNVQSSNVVDFTNREFLENNEPTEHFNDQNSSSKYDAEREVNIQKGLIVLTTLKLGETSINPLLLLLAKWWEVKPARAAIKDMIYAEAESKGFEGSDYLQNQLGKQVDVFAEFQTAIDRVRYAKTYFKPRKPITSKVITKLLQIDGIVYVVPVAKLEDAKIEFAGDKEALKNAVKEFSTVQEAEIENL